MGCGDWIVGKMRDRPTNTWNFCSLREDLAGLKSVFLSGGGGERGGGSDDRHRHCPNTVRRTAERRVEVESVKQR